MARKWHGYDISAVSFLLYHEINARGIKIAHPEKKLKTEWAITKGGSCVAKDPNSTARSYCNMASYKMQ